MVGRGLYLIPRVDQGEDEVDVSLVGAMGDTDVVSVEAYVGQKHPLVGGWHKQGDV